MTVTLRPSSFFLPWIPKVRQTLRVLQLYHLRPLVLGPTPVRSSHSRPFGIWEFHGEKIRATSKLILSPDTCRLTKR
jgi:hypothetical protein